MCELGMPLPPITDDPAEAWLLEEALRLRYDDEQQKAGAERVAVERAQEQGRELLAGMR